MKTAVLYSYADGKNYEVNIDENTDLDSDDFDWEQILLEPIENNREMIDTTCGVSWGWMD